MTVDCHRVRRHIQLRFDSDEGSLSERDAIHIESCPRCGGLFRRYSQFARELRAQAAAGAAGLAGPDWQAVFTAATAGSAAGTAANEIDARAGREPATRRLRERLAARREGSRRIGEGTGIAPGKLPAWATGTAARAALLAVVICFGALFGYREYRFAAARSFLRTNTTEFVNTIFSSSIFSASPETTADLADAAAVDSTWFDASSPNTQLPLVPPGSTSAETQAP